MKTITTFKDTLKVRGRVPRKLKKALKKDKYFNLFGWIWIGEIKWKPVRKALKTYYDIKSQKTEQLDLFNFGEAESIQAPNHE